MAYLSHQYGVTDGGNPMLPPRNRQERLIAVTVAITSSGDMLFISRNELLEGPHGQNNRRRDDNPVKRSESTVTNWTYPPTPNPPRTDIPIPKP